MGRVVIVGAGILGLSSAFHLQQRGWTVTVVDQRTPGYGASRVNAGWVCPSFSEPVPSPGLVGQSMRWMRHSDSPLYIQPKPDPAMARWLYAFWRHCNAADYEAGTAAAAGLNARTFRNFDAMREAGVEFEEHRDGILFVYRDSANMISALADAQGAEKHGIPLPKEFWGDALLAEEPALKAGLAGGLLYEQDRSVRPDTFTDGLVAWLAERGVTIRPGTRVTGFDRSGDRVTNVRLEQGRIETDAVLVCAGVWSGEVTALAGRRLPLQGGKGYALDYAPPPQHLNHPLDLPEARVAITPMDGMTRWAGTMEFSGINETIRPERVEAIVRGGNSVIEGWDAQPTRISSGLRPMTPDGLPAIGWLPGYRNLAVAAGHGMLGLTLGPSTGEAVADLMTTGYRPEVLEPFDPGRFGRW